MLIAFKEWEKINDTLFGLLGDFCGKTMDQVKKDAERDCWLSSQEALEYGIIDEVIKSRR